MTVDESILQATRYCQSFGIGADLALRRTTTDLSRWALKAHSNALGTSAQAIAGPFTGTLAHPSAASALGIASTSANDTAAGTGARTVRITGLNSSYDVATEDVTLNGQTKVVTSATFIAVLDVQVLTAGSGGVNAGVLYVADDGDTFTSGVPTVPYMVVDVGWNIAAPSVYTVPDGYELALGRLSVTCDNGKTTTVYVEVYGSTSLWERRMEVHVGSGASETLLSEAVVAARQRVRVRGLVNTGTGNVSVLIMGVLRTTE